MTSNPMEPHATDWMTHADILQSHLGSVLKLQFTTWGIISSCLIHYINSWFTVYQKGFLCSLRIVYLVIYLSIYLFIYLSISFLFLYTKRNNWVEVHSESSPTNYRYRKKYVYLKKGKLFNIHSFIYGILKKFSTHYFMKIHKSQLLNMNPHYISYVNVALYKPCIELHK